MKRKLKIGETVYAVLYNQITLTVVKTIVTSIVTTERENGKIEVEYYYKDEANKNNSSFNKCSIYTEDEFKEYLNKHFFTGV